MNAGTQTLVKMANQIGAFFRSEPDREAAVAAIENHIRRFWDPRMRKAIVAYVESGGAGLDSLAAEAVKKLAARTPAGA